MRFGGSVKNRNELSLNTWYPRCNRRWLQRSLLREVFFHPLSNGCLRVLKESPDHRPRPRRLFDGNYLKMYLRLPRAPYLVLLTLFLVLLGLRQYRIVHLRRQALAPRLRKDLSRFKRRLVLPLRHCLMCQFSPESLR